MSPEPHYFERVTIHAEKLVVGEEPKPTPQERIRFVVNAILFAATSIILTIGFKAHLEPYVTGMALLGTVSIFAVLQVILSAFTAIFDPKDVRQKLLGRKGTLPNLVIALLAASGMYFSTKSLNVRLSGDAPKVVVEVRRGKEQITAPIVLDYDHPTAGRPFFFTWGADELTAVVTDPPGYKEKPVKLGIIDSSETLTFPHSFDPKDYHVIRIVIGVDISGDVPDRDDPVQGTIEIRAAGKTYTAKDIDRHSVIYLGGDQKTLERLAKVHHDEFLRKHREYLTVQKVPDLETRMAFIAQQRIYVPTDELKSGEDVVITLTGGTETFTKTTKAPASEIDTVIVGKS